VRRRTGPPVEQEGGVVASGFESEWLCQGMKVLHDEMNLPG